MVIPCQLVLSRMLGSSACCHPKAAAISVRPHATRQMGASVGYRAGDQRSVVSADGRAGDPSRPSSHRLRVWTLLIDSRRTSGSVTWWRDRWFHRLPRRLSRRQSHRRDPDEYRRSAPIRWESGARNGSRHLGRPTDRNRRMFHRNISIGAVAGKYQMGSAIITVVRNGDHLTLSSQNSVEHLWESDFVFRGDGTFAAMRNSELRLTFTPVEGQGPRLSITLSGRAFGDATRLTNLAGDADKQAWSQRLKLAFVAINGVSP